jgi:hypothetical protein
MELRQLLAENALRCSCWFPEQRVNERGPSVLKPPTNHRCAKSGPQIGKPNLTGSKLKHRQLQTTHSFESQDGPAHTVNMAARKPV